VSFHGVIGPIMLSKEVNIGRWKGCDDGDKGFRKLKFSWRCMWWCMIKVVV